MRKAIPGRLDYLPELDLPMIALCPNEFPLAHLDAEDRDDPMFWHEVGRELRKVMDPPLQALGQRAYVLSLKRAGIRLPSELEGLA